MTEAQIIGFIEILRMTYAGVGDINTEPFKTLEAATEWFETIYKGHSEEDVTLGERLKQLRLEGNRTLKEQSEILGVSLNTVYRWESNMTIPRRGTLIAIAKHYGVSTEWLLNEKTLAEEIDHMQRRLLDMFKQLSWENRYKIWIYLEFLLFEMEEK